MALKLSCRRALPRFVVGVVMVCLLGQAARGQAVRVDVLQATTPGSRFELDPTVQLDRVGGTVPAQLERFKAYLADRQWEEAIRTLREVTESSEEKLFGVTERRFVNLRQYGHLLLATLPEEGLRFYRGLVDPSAESWFREGIAKRDRRLLENVTQRAFASSWGDDALMALGEMALESGDYAAARSYFARIVPSEAPPDMPPTRPGYPDTDLDPAAVRARLVLVSILEGSTARANEELVEFTRLHPEAKGPFGGRTVNYAQALGVLIAESAAWPPRPTGSDWPTFAGSPTRQKIAPEMIDVAAVAWRLPLHGDRDKEEAGPSFHPVISGHLVLVNNLSEILAVDVATGKPAWGEAGAVIYRAPRETLAERFRSPFNALGTPQSTLTVFRDVLCARMGNTLTGRPQQPLRTLPHGYLVCLDLASQGRLVCDPIRPEEGWAFEGTPISDGVNLYVAMRRNEMRPQAHVACFDIQTGRRRWRRLICGAETPARATYYQHTHNLLTLHRQTLYYNTNLGAVAALSIPDGQVKWVSLYPRAQSVDPANLAPHWRRELTPCLYIRGMLLVAPADSPRIFAFDAVPGQPLWKSGAEVEDAVYLLGATETHLIAAGGRIYWIALQAEKAGRVTSFWPVGPEKPGYGRGLAAGRSVLFPTRDKIHVFDQRTAQPLKTIDLAPRGVTGGNLLIAGNRLLIATDSELVALGPEIHLPAEDTNKVTFSANSFSRRRYVGEPREHPLADVPSAARRSNSRRGTEIK